MLKEYSIPKNEFITWALSNKSWKLLSVTHGTEKINRKSTYVWITESGRLVSLETTYYPKVESNTIRDGLTQQVIDRNIK